MDNIRNETRGGELEPWFAVKNRKRLAPMFPAPAPVFLFHSLTNTGSASAMKVLQRYMVEKAGWNVSEAPRAAADNPMGPVGDFFERFYINFISVYNPQSQHVALIFCHYLFGIHHFLSRPCSYFTILRDPVTHYISSVWFAHKSRKLPGLPNFEDWLAWGENSMVHDIARVFCHVGEQRDLSEKPQFAEAKPTPDRALRMAMDNIDKYYHFIGITERFEESLFLFADNLGFSELPLWTQEMATKGRPKKEDLPSSLLRKIEAAVACDQILYDEAMRRFDKRMAEADFGPELIAYKAKMAERGPWTKTSIWHQGEYLETTP